MGHCLGKAVINMSLTAGIGDCGDITDKKESDASQWYEVQNSSQSSSHEGSERIPYSNAVDVASAGDQRYVNEIIDDVELPISASRLTVIDRPLAYLESLSSPQADSSVKVPGLYLAASQGTAEHNQYCEQGQFQGNRDLEVGNGSCASPDHTPPRANAHSVEEDISPLKSSDLNLLSFSPQGSIIFPEFSGFKGATENSAAKFNVKTLLDSSLTDINIQCDEQQPTAGPGLELKDTLNTDVENLMNLLTTSIESDDTRDPAASDITCTDSNADAKVTAGSDASKIKNRFAPVCDLTPSKQGRASSLNASLPNLRQIAKLNINRRHSAGTPTALGLPENTGSTVVSAPDATAPLLESGDALQSRDECGDRDLRTGSAQPTLSATSEPAIKRSCGFEAEIGAEERLPLTDTNDESDVKDLSRPVDAAEENVTKEGQCFDRDIPSVEPLLTTSILSSADEADSLLSSSSANLTDSTLERTVLEAANQDDVQTSHQSIKDSPDSAISSSQNSIAQVEEAKLAATQSDLTQSGLDQSSVSPSAMEDNISERHFTYSFDENINPFETRCKLGQDDAGNKNTAVQKLSTAMPMENDSFAMPKSAAQKRKKAKGSSVSPKQEFSAANGPDVACDAACVVDHSEQDHHHSASNSSSSGSSAAFIDNESIPSEGFEDVDPAFLQKLSKGNRRRIDKVSTCSKSKETVTSTQDPLAQVKMSESFEAVVKEVEDISTRSIEGSLPNQSEAGPDVAQFTEEEFRSAAEFFKDPAAFEFLQKAGSSKTLQKSALARLSLYVKFDPLLKNTNSPVPACPHDAETGGGIERGQQIRNSESAAVGTPGPSCQSMEEPESAGLINFDSPYKRLSQGPNERTRDVHSEPDLVSSHCQEQKMFTEDEVNQALKMQELLFQEKFIKKEKEFSDSQKVWGKEKMRMNHQIGTLKEAVHSQRTIANELAKLIETMMRAKMNERVEMTENNQKLTKERDQALEDLQNVENAFGDLYRRYEKTKGVLEQYKQQEEVLKQQLEECHNKIKKQEQMYEMLRSRTEEKLDSANVEIETARKSGEAELAVLKAQLKKAEMRIISLEKGLEQKNTENAELSNICDELIAKVGKV